MIPRDAAYHAPMKAILAAALLALTATPAVAADYVCKGEYVEKSGSTQYKVVWSSGKYTVEKSGGTRGYAIQGSGKFTVEASGSTLATIENDKIYKSGSSWATIAEAQKIYDCPGTIAATLWVLKQTGKLD